MAKRMKAGDLFTITLPDGTELAARIVLDVMEQCIKPKLLRASAPLTFYADTVMQEIYRGPTPASGVLIPAVFTWPEALKVSGHQPVVPEAVEFPQGLLGRGIHPQFTWGELELPVPLSEADLRRIDVSPPIEGSGNLKELALYALGRKAEIDTTMYREPEVFSTAKLDLRFSPHRDEVYRLLGSRIGSGYYETALRYGYDLKRFYGAQYRDRELVLCPYCHAPFERSQPICKSCGEDTRNDAPLSVTAQEMAEEPRKPCRACRTYILSTAVICPGCKASQQD